MAQYPARPRRRRILIEIARYKKSLKAGGEIKRVDLDDAVLAINPALGDLLALDDALTKLAREDPAAGEVAKLRLFAGLSVEQAARSLGISRTTGFRHWSYARAFLQIELQEVERD